MRNFILLAGLLCFVVGCGPGGNMVTGKVTLDDGSPAPRGSVMLRSDAGSFQGVIGPDGTYTIENVANGDYQVAVLGVTDQAVDMADAEGGGAGKPKPGSHDEQGGGPGEGGGDPESYMEGEEDTSLIDAKYSNPTTSGITISVPGGDYNITVDRAGGAAAPAEAEAPAEGGSS